MPPTLTIVHDGDSVLTPALTSRNNPDHGVIVAMPRAGMRSLGWLATDLLAAVRTSTSRSRGADGWPVAAAHLVPWVVAKRICHVVIGYAETLSANHLASLAQFGQLTETSMWFVADTSFTDTLAAFQAEFAAPSITHEEFERHFASELASDSNAAPPPAQVDAAPDDHFLTFLATARRTLPADSFNRVLTLFVDAFDSTDLWLQSRESQPDENDVVAHLNELIQGQRTLAAVTTTIHGMQAAAFRQGLLVKVSARHFLNRMQDTRTSLDLTPDEWIRLGDGGTTRQGAIAVLAATGIPVTEIVDIKASQLAPDGSTIRTDERLVDVPKPARYLLQAQLLYRACAADPNNPRLLAGSRKDEDFTIRGASLAIDRVSRNTGIAFRARHDTWNSTAVRWRQRSGVSITELAA